MKTNPEPIVLKLEQTIECKCPHCGNETFKQVYAMRRVPGLLVGQVQDGFQPFPVWICSKCHGLVDFAKSTPEKAKKGAKIVRWLEIAASILPYFLRKK